MAHRVSLVYNQVRKSVSSVDEFNMDTIRIYENCFTPLFIMVMDMAPEKRREAESHLGLLRRSAKKYSDFLLYTYANSSDQFIKERKIAVEKVPGAILTFRDGSIIPYPKEWSFDDANMDKFVEFYLRKKLPKSESEVSQPDYDARVYNDLAAVKLLRSSTFNDTVLEDGKYVLVYFFSSKNETLEYFAYIYIYNRQSKAAIEVNHIAEIIRDLKINDVLVSGFDLSIEPNPMPREVDLFK